MVVANFRRPITCILYPANEPARVQRAARVELRFHAAHEAKAVTRVSPHVNEGAYFGRGAPYHEVGPSGLGFLSKVPQEERREFRTGPSPAQQRVAVAHVRPH